MPSIIKEHEVDDVLANHNDNKEDLWENIPIVMATPPRSPPYSLDPSGVPVVNVNPTTRRGSIPHKEKFQSYLGSIAREKIPIVHPNWKVVSESLKNLIWDVLLGKFNIPEASNAKKKVMSSVATRWRQINMVLIHRVGRNLFQAIKPQLGRKKSPEIQKYNNCPHLLSHGGYDLLEKKFMEKKRKKGQEEAIMLCLLHDSLQEQTTQGSFISHGCQDILNTTIGRPDQLGPIHAAGVSVTINQYFKNASHGSNSSTTLINLQ
ncbi:hypothetical protein GmHk_03G006660 [Glycine max]|nr:hypothetical protein GmHk_03G006660 [Glycine max]